MTPFAVQAEDMSHLREQLQAQGEAYAAAQTALRAAKAQVDAQAQDLHELRQQLTDSTAAAESEHRVLQERLRTAEAASEAAAAAERLRMDVLADLQATVARQEQELAEARAVLTVQQAKQRDVQPTTADSVPKQRSLADAFNFVPKGGAANGAAGGHTNVGEVSGHSECLAALDAAAAEAQQDAADARRRLAAAAEEAAAREARWEDEASQLRAALAEARSVAERTSQQLEASRTCRTL